MESLELRVLRSVSALDTPPTDTGTGTGTDGTGGGTNPPPVDCVSAETIAADRQKITDDLAKLASDRAAGEQNVQQKSDALDAARQALQTQAAPLRSKLSQDRSQCEQTLRADQFAIQQANQSLFKQIMNDVKAVVAAKGDAAARQAAIDKLAADRQQLQTTLAPLLEKLQKDATDCATLLAADQKAIDDLFANDPAVKAAQAALDAARKQAADTLAADRATLDADRGQLDDDLEHQCDGQDTDGDGDHDENDHQNDDDHHDDDEHENDDDHSEDDDHEDDHADDDEHDDVKDENDDHHQDDDHADDDKEDDAGGGSQGQGDHGNGNQGHRNQGNGNHGNSARQEALRRAALAGRHFPFAG
jgi:hypothetical protein